MTTATRFAAAAVFAWSLAAAAQSPDTVSVYVDESSDSSANQYQLAIDGLPVTIDRVVAGPHPVSAVILIDASKSVGAPTIPAGRFSSAARAGDSIRFCTFAKHILLSTAFATSERDATAAARAVAQRDGPSPVWDATYAALDAIRDASGLRAVVMFTDGMATGNDRSFSEVEALLAETGAIVSAVGIGDDALKRSSMVAVGRNDGLKRLVSHSGGQYSELPRPSGTPVHALVAMFADLRNRTRIDFRPPVRDGAIHRVAVTRDGRAVQGPARLKF